jgi:hypothetical protein
MSSLQDLDELDSIIDTIDDRSAPPKKANGRAASDDADLDDMCTEFFFFFSFSTLCNFRLNDLETAKPSTTSQPTLPSNASKPRIPEVTRVAAPVASSSYPSDPRVSSLDFGFGAGNTPSGHSTTTTTTVTSTHNNAPSQQGLSRVSELDFGLNDIASPPKKTTTYTSSVMASKPAASVSPAKSSYTPPSNTTTTTTTTTSRYGGGSSDRDLDGIVADLKDDSKRGPRGFSTHPNAAPGNGKCGKCGLDVSGTATTVNGLEYHATCFVCSQCDRQITGSFQMKDNAPFCNSCVPTVKCSKCGGVITGTYVEQDGRICHASCVNLSGCAKCHGDLRGAIVTAGDARYHPHCFVCVQCSAELRSYVTVPGRGVMCQSCGQSATGLNCTKCSRPLVDEYVTFEGGKFHSACFSCANCSTPLGSASFMKKDGRPFCQSCAR